MIKKKNIAIPYDTVKRLSIYLRTLKRLAEKGITSVSSAGLTRYLQISPEQCRKDLSYFGGFGKRGVGYNIPSLARELEIILGTDEEVPSAIFGIGKLGSALLGYSGFSEYNIKIVLAFDNDLAKIGRTWEGIRIEPVSSMQKLIAEKRVKTGILTVPADAALDISRQIFKTQIRAILNFTPINISPPADTLIVNVDMASELASLVCRMKNNERIGRM